MIKQRLGLPVSPDHCTKCDVNVPTDSSHGKHAQSQRTKRHTRVKLNVRNLLPRPSSELNFVLEAPLTHYGHQVAEGSKACIADLVVETPVGNMFLDFMVTRPKEDTKDVLKISAAKENEEAKKKLEKYAKSHPSAKELIKPIVFEENGTWSTDALVTLKYVVDLITPENDERNKLFRKLREVVAVAIHTGNYFINKQIWDNELDSANKAKLLKQKLRIGKRLGQRKKLIRRNRTGKLVAPPPQEVDPNLGNSETSVASLAEDGNEYL